MIKKNCIFTNFFSVNLRESEKLLLENKDSQETEKESPKIEKKSFFNLKKGFSIYFKILLNYTQMTAIIHSLEFKWSFYVDNYLNISSPVGSPGDVISLDCVMNDENIQVNSLHAKALIAVIFPFVIMAMIIIILTFLKIIKKQSYKNRIFIAYIVMSIFLQPTILQMLFDNLNYTTINGVSYLTKSLTLRFDDQEHIKWVIC